MKNCTSNGKLPNRLQMTKWVTVAVLALAVTASAQAPVTETLGVGTPTTTCSYSNVCTTPVLDTQGLADGTIEIHASTGVLHRYAIDGTALWTSVDYSHATGNFTHGGMFGSLTYTLASKSVRCGGEGRWTYTCVYRWVASGSLTE